MNFHSKINHFSINAIVVLVIILSIALDVLCGVISDIASFFVLFTLASSTFALLFTLKKPLIALPSALIACLSSAFITGSVLSAFNAICPVILGYLLMLVFTNKLTRSGAIGISSTVITLILVSALVINVFSVKGYLSLDTIRATYDSFFSWISSLLCNSFFVTIAGDKVSLITSSSAVRYLNTLIGISLGIISSIVGLCGYFASIIYKKLMEITVGILPNKNNWRLLPSPITTGFFIAAYIISALETKVSIFTLTATNIFLIFTPTFFSSGLSSAFETKTVSGIKVPKLLRPFLLIASFFYGIVSFFTICILFGVYDSIMTLFQHKKIKN